MPYRPRHQRHRALGCLGRILTFLVLMVILVYPFAEPFMLRTETTNLTSDHLPRSIGQLRMVYVSDIHAGPFFSQSRVKDLVSRINALNADLVLFGGDYATDSDGAVEFFKHLPPVNARYGVFGVLGNHDRTIPESNLSLLKTSMISSGVTPLVNMVQGVRIGPVTVYIAGIDDPNNGWPDLKEVASQVRQEDYVIFLSHSPEVIPDALKAEDRNGRRNWFDLGLFGHTHGGQIAFAGDLLNIAKVENRYERGWIKENRIDMLITNGVGTSILPLRLFRPPQLHLITVKSTKGGVAPSGLPYQRRLSASSGQRVFDPLDSQSGLCPDNPRRVFDPFETLLGCKQPDCVS